MEIEKDIGIKGQNVLTDTYESSVMIGQLGYGIVLLKVEKISGAVFLLTNHIDSAESIRRSLRSLALAILKDMHWFPHERSLAERNLMMRSFVAVGRSLLSHLRIARLAGLISPQNESVLKREVEQLLPAFDGSVFLEEKALFPDEAVLVRAMRSPHTPATAPKDSKGHTTIKRTHATERNGAARAGRRQKIMAFLRGKESVGIKDICDQFVGVSGKTIQRELGKLVAERAVGRAGNKRWSRYSLLAA